MKSSKPQLMLLCIMIGRKNRHEHSKALGPYLRLESMNMFLFNELAAKVLTSKLRAMQRQSIKQRNKLIRITRSKLDFDRKSRSWAFAYII